MSKPAGATFSKDFTVSHHPCLYHCFSQGSHLTPTHSWMWLKFKIALWRGPVVCPWREPEEQPLVAGMWINMGLREQERLPLCLESEQNLSKKAAQKGKRVQDGFISPPAPSADIHDLVKKIRLLQRLHVVIFKCREKPNVAFIFPSDKLPIAGFTYRTL